MKIVEPRTKQFQRNKEDFVCISCGIMVLGDGYTNHCPGCLISKHVDVNPGDRAADCGGSMDVIDIGLEHGELILTHQCVDCGHKKRNRAHREDSIDRIVQLMKDLHE